MRQKTGAASRTAQKKPRPPSLKAVLQVNCPLCGADVLQLCVNLLAPTVSKKNVQEYLRANLHAHELACRTPHEARVRWYAHVQKVKQETLAAQNAESGVKTPKRDSKPALKPR